MTTYRDLEWMSDALCTQIGGDAFYPDKGRQDDARAAQSICRICPVADRCREYGDMDAFGVYGATTPRERARARREGAA